MSVTVLAWLAVPLAATLIAIAWTYLASRPARRTRALDSMEAYQRFRAAMTSSSAPPPTRPGGHPRADRLHPR